MKEDDFFEEAHPELQQHDRPCGELSRESLVEPLPGLSMRRRTFLRVMGNGLAIFFAAFNSPHVMAGVDKAEEGDLDAWIHIG